jgi:outer membrane protein
MMRPLHRRPWKARLSTKAALVFGILPLLTLPGGIRGAQAASAAARSLSLVEALRLALDGSPRLGALRAQEEAAQASARNARSGLFPQLGLNASYTRYSEITPFAITLPGRPAIEVFPNIPNGYLSRLNLPWPVFTGGRIAKAVEAAGHEAASAGEDLRAGRADLILETTQGYWGLVTARESEAVLDSALIAYEHHLRDAQNRQKAGLAAANEVLAVEVERDRAQVARLQAHTALESAQANLLRLTGLPPESGIAPSDPLDGGPWPRAERMIATPLDSLVQAAMRRRPERQALAGRLQAAQARVGSEKGAYWPQLAAGAGYDYSRPNRRITPLENQWEHTWDASVSLSMSLFDGGRAGAAVDRASAQVEAVREQLEDWDRRLRLEILSRTLDLETAIEAERVAGRALESAGQNRKVSADRYQQGVGSSSDLLDAEVVLLRAGLERTEARARVRLAQATLERALGRSL